MVNKLELIDNYVICTDTSTGKEIGQYAVNHSVYSTTEDGFIIKEVIDDGRLIIKTADIIAGKWVDKYEVAFSEATMRDFLRANTGFKTALGGSGVIQETITFNPAQLLAWTSENNLILKPSAATGTFYIPFLFVFKFKAGTSAYSLSNPQTKIRLGINGNFNVYSSLDKNIIESSTDVVMISPPQASLLIEEPSLDGGVNSTVAPTGNISDTIELYFSKSDTTVSGGNGTLLVDIYYEIGTF